MLTLICCVVWGVVAVVGWSLGQSLRMLVGLFGDRPSLLLNPAKWKLSANQGSPKKGGEESPEQESSEEEDSDLEDSEGKSLKRRSLESGGSNENNSKGNNNSGSSGSEGEYEYRWTANVTDVSPEGQVTGVTLDKWLVEKGVEDIFFMLCVVESYEIKLYHSRSGTLGTDDLVSAFDGFIRLFGGSNNPSLKGCGFPLEGHRLKPICLNLEYVDTYLAKCGVKNPGNFIYCGNTSLYSYSNSVHLCFSEALCGIYEEIYGPEETPSRVATNRLMSEIVDLDLEAFPGCRCCAVLVCQNSSKLGWPRHLLGDDSVSSRKLLGRQMRLDCKIYICHWGSEVDPSKMITPFCAECKESRNLHCPWVYYTIGI